jgi:hypothetical protein
MLRCVALVKTNVSEELSASIIRVKRVGELGTLVVTSNRRARYEGIQSEISLIDYCHSDDGGAKFLRNIGSCKSHTA